MTARLEREASARWLAFARARRIPPWLAVVMENLAIAAGYTLLGWVGARLRLSGEVVVFWPAGGFALAVLLVRGSGRWPGIMLGSFIVTLFVVGPSGFDPAQGREGILAVVTALLGSGARTLSTLAGAWLVARATGLRRWPHTTRQVLAFALTAGLAYPALVALGTLLSRWVWQPQQLSFVLLSESWLWFVANSAGTLVVAPLLLALLERRVARPSRSLGEVALTALGFVVAALVATNFAWGAASSVPLAYPLTPLMLWCALRFGSQGAVLSTALWAVVLLVAALSRPDVSGPMQVFSELHAQLAVLTTVVLALAAAFEERHQLQYSLEMERNSLEARVAERTQELARNLSLLHSSLESTEDGLLVVDLQGRIVATNQRFAEMWRIPSEIVESGDDERALSFVREKLTEPERFLERVQYLYAHPEVETEDEFTLKDGRIFQRFSRPQRLGDDVVGRVWSFRDVTLRRRTEAERNQLLVEESRARQEAERALALRDDFLQVAAHEMKTPVTSMKLQLQQLGRLLAGDAQRPPDPARIHRIVAAVLRPMRRFEELSDQLLDVKRFEAGPVALQYEQLDFEEAIRRELELHREAAARAGSQLRFECTGPVPGESDRRQLTQITDTLLSNAIKFGAGSPLTIRLDASPERVLLQVIDRGIGIAAEDQRRILGRFERAVDSRHYGGLGLGLWLARQSVEALGGALSVESEPGQGSTFSVLLPRWRPGNLRPVGVPDSAQHHA